MVLKVLLVQPACAQCIREQRGGAINYSRFSASTRVPGVCHKEMEDFRQEELRRLDP